MWWSEKKKKLSLKLLQEIRLYMFMNKKHENTTMKT